MMRRARRCQRVNGMRSRRAISPGPVVVSGRVDLLAVEGNVPGVVAVQPRRVVVASLHPGVRARDGLDARGPRLTVCLVTREGVAIVVAVDAGETAREDG